MKIIKKSQDFYDSVLGYGVDETIIYKREVEDIAVFGNWWSFECLFSSRIEERGDEGYRKLPASFKKLLKDLSDTSLEDKFELKESYNRSVRIIGSYIIFCGEVIPVLTVEGSWDIHPRKETEKSFTEHSFKESAYTLDGLKKILEMFFKESTIESYLEGTRRWSETRRKDVFKAFFEGAANISAEDVHHDIDCPVIQIKAAGYIKNPVLKELKFARKYDPFTTYQKLEMFISGVLGGQTPKMVEIADIDRLVGHGFDKKVSFRKRKQE